MAKKTEPRKDGVYKQRDGSIEWQVDGVVWKVAPFDMENDYKAAEQHLIDSRPSPIAAVLPEYLSLKENYPELAKELLDRAYADLKKGPTEMRPNRFAVRDWLDTLDGLAWTMRRAIARSGTEVTDEQVRQIISRASVAEAARVRDMTLPGAGPEKAA